MDLPYKGEEALVMCIDIGTTMSAVSLIHLEPNVVPTIRTVNSWAGAPSASKVPSIILYDSRGRAQSFGAEVLTDSKQLESSSKGWKQARWFKLHLHPQSMEPPMYSLDPSRASERVFEVPKLPRGVTSQKAYEDFLRFLLRGTEKWVEGNYPDGRELWIRLKDKMIFVVAHPNGWETAQQAELTTALRRALSVPALDDRVVFVTEAEASVHYALQNSGNQEWLQTGTQFAVVDAGGSTVDTCIYEVERTFPKLQLKEVKNSDCVQAGAIFPLRQARFLIDAKLRSSKFKSPEYLDRIMQEWDEKVKPNFSGVEDQVYLLRFGFEKDNDAKHGVTKGRLTLSASEIAMAFSPSINLILASIESQLKETKARHILLTGGFGASPYLQNRLRSTYSPLGIQIVSTDDPSQKAVSIGAALFYLKEVVVARAARFDYGTKITVTVSKEAKELGRRKVYTATDGKQRTRGGWERIVKRGQILQVDEMISKSLIHDIAVGDSLVSPYEVLCTRDSELGAGDFVLDEYGDRYPGFESCAIIEVDLKHLATPQTLKTNPLTGQQYYSLEYKIGIFFGGTALKACYIWEEDGVEKRGKAAVIPAAFT